MLNEFRTRINVCFSSKLVSIVTLITTIVSLITLVLSYACFPDDVPLKITVLFIVALILLIILLIIVLMPFFQANVYDKNKHGQKIDGYMENLYKNATGKIIISTTGSMKWATPKILEVLEEKAKSSGVVVFVPQKNEKTRRLESVGAKIIDSSVTNTNPNLNFSIVNPGADDALIAIGRSSNKNIHYITEYEAKSDVMVVARELARLLENV